jgi:methylmalonyl-CoA mutase cobalamin-binding subunit
VNAPNQTPYRNLVTKVGLDGHDRGSRIVAAYLCGWGLCKGIGKKVQQHSFAIF